MEGKMGTQWVPPSSPYPFPTISFLQGPCTREGAAGWSCLGSIFGAGEVGRAGRLQ